jgi:hypothetical protein
MGGFLPKEHHDPEGCREEKHDLPEDIKAPVFP